jgi:hypothetical protein
MSNEMIERVAKAMFDKFCPGIRYVDNDKVWYEEAAQCAIEAMKEPTEAMLDAGAYDLDMTLKQQWKLMIEAALK